MSKKKKRKDITGEIRKYFNMNKYEEIAHPNSWDSIKAIIRGNFIVVRA